MRVTTNYFSPSRLIAGLMLCATMLFFAPTNSSAMTDVYQLSQSIGKAMDMTGSTQIHGPNRSLVASPTIAIGFTFKFDGRDYTTFSANSSGLMSLGRVTERYYYGWYFPNYTRSSFGPTAEYPVIAPQWTSYARPTSTGQVHYKMSGTAPNRVLTIEWNSVRSFGSTYYRYPGGTYQVRLYETSNKIEFHYGTMYDVSTYSYAANIGIASSTSRYINVWGNDITESYVYPSGQASFYRYSYRYPMTLNRVFTFNPCEKAVKMTGNIAEGGTVDMDPDEDVLLEGKQVKRGSYGDYSPMTIEVPSNGCDPLTWTATFSGPGAADYAVLPGTVPLGDKGGPIVRFTPSDASVRNATMNISFSNGDKYSFDVAAEGLNRIDWFADVNEGGVTGMANGATLLSNIDVERGMSRDLMPFSIGNNNADGNQKPAVITYKLEDPLDEYNLALPNGTVTGTTNEQNGTETIGANQKSTPVITFSPTPAGTNFGTGPQEATLTVTVDDDVRVFTLAGFSVASQLEIAFDDIDVIKSDRNFFRGVVTCVGDQNTQYAVQLDNVNRKDVTIFEVDIYEVDSRFQQGAPPYPNMFDGSHRGAKEVMSTDYVFATSPGVAPLDENTAATFPMVIPAGESRTLYLTYVGQRPGKRYARAFMRTDAVNFFGPAKNVFNPTAGTKDPSVEGQMTVNFFGRALGSHLAGDADGNLEGLNMTFGDVKVGESIESETTIHNTGECELRISQTRARLTTGDVEEFELLSIFGEATVEGTDFVIAPGGTATLKARFTPSRSGSRRASVAMQTNDSTVGGTGITGRGLFYLDLYGVGSAELEAFDLALDPAVVDGPGSNGMVQVVNTSTEIIEVTNLELVGANIDEIMMDAANPWPAMPIRMQPGDVLPVGVALMPMAGAADGPRNAQLVVTYGSGKTATADINGLVGTRMLMATPATLFEGMQLPIGEIARQSAIIVNNGTFPIQLTDVRIEGAGAADYQMHMSGRTIIDAGGFEVVEVTYAPTAAGASDATLVIESNATNGGLAIVLGGMAAGTSQSGSASGSNGTDEVETGGSSGRAATPAGLLELGSLAPNPARDMVSFTYGLPTDGAVALGIYDVNGNLVRSIEQGNLVAGTHTADFDVHALSSGIYVLRLSFNGTVVTRPMTVVN
mgnify:CR=1 FL=1